MNSAPDFFTLKANSDPDEYVSSQVDSGLSDDTLNLPSDALDLMIYAINTAVTNPKQDLNKLDHLHRLVTDLKNFKLKLGENE